ncbi:GNAT family N-acetyltransferase [Pseudomonas benzenivorans]|uniref:GNAT family N-acetyltransferase n=1 Tax=Pseudomonas benzenivorans TaxID=556533 RepID=A0ABY5HD42_9PSED|nr:GNAT family N-acetyltransferase [Pseudomonas benzenivorans]UTW09185.1 GNAT family N-acetyltransferase [Pseudomonas benzenivorans]
MTPETLGMRVSLIPWESLTPNEQRSVSALDISPQQIEYAGTIEHSIELCEASHAGNIVGLAIKHGADVVGFFLLKRRSDAPVWAADRAAVVSAMRVDQSRQGKGLGTAALHALALWVEEYWPESSAIMLSVDEGNGAGIRAYGKAGFQELGIREQGRIGWVRYMTLATPLLSPGPAAP